MNLNLTMGETIARLRKSKGYTQDQVANLLGVSPQAVSKWENGHALPDIALLPAIARVMNTSIDRLLTGQDSIVPAGPYDQEYQLQDYYWGLEPSYLARQIVESVSKKTTTADQYLLDIGSGEGRDACYFAQHGFIVDALEISQPGINKIYKLKERYGLPITPVHNNMIGYEPVRNYNVIYSMGSLQFLPVEQRGPHFFRYKKFTLPGGINAHMVFVEKPFIDRAPDWQLNEFFYRSGEMAGYYWDWEIIKNEELIVDCQSSNVEHQHAVSIIIARKPE